MSVWHWAYLFLLGLLLAGCARDEEVTDPTVRVQDDYDYAAGGLSFAVVLNGVGAQIESVETRPAEEQGTPGYVYVVLNLGISNQSRAAVLPGGLVLMDDHENRYVTRQTDVPFGAELAPMPLSIEAGETVMGHHVFVVPEAALAANLRLRWESERHESIIEIFLGEPIPSRPEDS